MKGTDTFCVLKIVKFWGLKLLYPYFLLAIFSNAFWAVYLVLCVEIMQNKLLSSNTSRSTNGFLYKSGQRIINLRWPHPLLICLFLLPPFSHLAHRVEVLQLLLCPIIILYVMCSFKQVDWHPLSYVIVNGLLSTASVHWFKSLKIQSTIVIEQI